MTKDRRLYAKFDIGMDEHAKIMLLSDKAFRALIESTLYSRRQLTDGFLDERIVNRKWGADAADELSTNHPENPSWRRVEGGWMIHDFAEHQTTTADIQAKREAGRKGGLAKKQDASKTEAGASKVLEQNGSKRLAKTETETETKRTSSSPATPSTEFNTFWAVYPKKVAKQAALKAWTKATKHTDPATITAGAQRYAEFVQRERTERQFIKSPDGWLNAGRWEDDITTAPQPKPSTGWQTGIHYDYERFAS